MFETFHALLFEEADGVTELHVAEPLPYVNEPVTLTDHTVFPSLLWYMEVFDLVTVEDDRDGFVFSVCGSEIVSIKVTK